MRVEGRRFEKDVNVVADMQYLGRMLWMFKRAVREAQKQKIGAKLSR